MRLPEEVCKLTGLRLLDLSTCVRLEEIPPNFIASLIQLEELYLDSNSIQWEVQGGSNASLDELKCLPHLTVLEIQIPNTSGLSKGLFSNTLERYNIEIGHRSRNYEFLQKWPKTSRTLELNLGDNCCFFEDVLHKTPSVKNVLSALHGGEGFPKLKQLWVHSSSCFRIVAECSESESYHPFHSLEILFLEELNNLEKIYNGQFGAEFLCQLRNIKVQKCDELKNIFSLSTIRDLPLEEIEVCDCANITEIFAIGKEEDIIHLKELRSIILEGLSQLTSFCSINNNEVISPTTTFNGKVEFPNLKTLKLSRINSEQIWQNQLLEIPSCFPSLEELYVDQCHKLKYLFSSLTVAFSSLEKIIISNMNDLEEIWHNQIQWIPSCFQSLTKLNVSGCHNLKHLFSSPTVAFPNLEMIEISHMNDLEMIWHNQLEEDSFRSLKSVTVINCNKLLTMFKFNMLERFTGLESLLVDVCNSLEDIFDLQDVNLEKLSHSTVSSQLRELSLYNLENVRHIWNKDPQRKLSFQKLNNVRIGNCWSLENIFPASIARNLSQLEQLCIYRCGAMEKIVAEEEGADLEAGTRFYFPRLTSLELRGLSQLRYFYPGRHTAEWPALNKLSISDCMELGLLASEENNEEGQLNTQGQQPLFFIQKGCFLKLDELQLTGESLRLISQDQFSEHLVPKLKFLKVDDGDSVIPPDILWRFPNLEKLYFTRGSCEEIFSLEEVEKHAEMPAQIKSLELRGIRKIKRIWKQHSKLDLIFQKLGSFACRVLWFD
ncbi:hypothetical protein Dsin_024206 [Dipteronia sinensis]|uniref:Disease resistance protein At4g27190-like leucine-rich repeats domain-containing protein n=1 Tax=Dipteronia sinensis TaxID=43782 RepID=A0AAE0A688_9ROSI|nr:hypothetical protein Dsin_024206 [Dipteronia sinensis]